MTALEVQLHSFDTVIPAQAGIQRLATQRLAIQKIRSFTWIPACAGMTAEG